jgi:hypothetical protein
MSIHSDASTPSTASIKFSLSGFELIAEGHEMINSGDDAAL